MTEILALLQNIAPLLEPRTFRQMSQVIFGMLAANGRITMLGLSRWAKKGGSYRTIQRLYGSVYHEEWADMFMNWVDNSFRGTGAQGRAHWMQHQVTNMMNP